MNRRVFLKLPPSIVISSAISFPVISSDNASANVLNQSQQRLQKTVIGELGIAPPKAIIDLPSGDQVSLVQKPTVIRRYDDFIFINYELDSGLYVYSLTGELINYISLSKKRGNIKDFAIDSQRQLIYVLKRAKHHIEVYDFAGEQLLIISEFGIDFESQLNGPSSITVDNQGRLHVLEPITSKVKVFESNGSYLFNYTKSRFNRNLKLNQLDGYQKIVATSKVSSDAMWIFDDDLRALTAL